MAVYTNIVEVTITMDAESASTANSVSAFVAREVAEQIKVRLVKANPRLPVPEIEVSGVRYVETEV